MKHMKIKTLLIVFPVLMLISVSTGLYFSNVEPTLENKSSTITINDSAKERTGFIDSSFLDEAPEVQPITNVDFLFKNKENNGLVTSGPPITNLDFFDDVMPEVLRKVEKAEKADQRRKKDVEQLKQSYKKYANYCWISAVIFGVLTLITLLIYLLAYLAKEYSYIRVMIAISFVWIFTVPLTQIDFGSQYWGTVEVFFVILSIMPILFFWAYRFIKYGAKQMLKDIDTDE